MERYRQMLKERLEHREEQFLDVVRMGIYENPCSPYRKMLAFAGCEYGDIESSTDRHGIERTLQNRREAGVCLTNGQFKGRQDIVRGEERYRFRDSDFNNPVYRITSSFRVAVPRAGGQESRGVKKLIRGWNGGHFVISTPI